MKDIPSCSNQNQHLAPPNRMDSRSDAGFEKSVHEPQPSIGGGAWSFPIFDPDRELKVVNHPERPPGTDSVVPAWDPRVMLSNLSFLEQKIHQIQDIVRSVMSREYDRLSSNRPCEAAAQQQLVTADLTSIIIQLISTAGTLLPSIRNSLPPTDASVRKLGSIVSDPASVCLNEMSPEGGRNKVADYEELFRGLGSSGREGEDLKYMSSVGGGGGEGIDFVYVEDHGVTDFDDGLDGENLPPGSYEVLQLEKDEILAPHTHFCLICGKGFKRDANLRMHMRGHGDEYKTPAALAKPSKETSSEPVPIKRYSCPFSGCKRNKEHKKFQPLKTILCVKNHYKRSHCDKSYTCSRCKAKKFSVIADLKTHEKHCGRDRWLCSCGTTFSRKDKLFGHVALFQGHTPALPPLDEGKAPLALDQAMSGDAASGWSLEYHFGGGASDNIDLLDIKVVDDERSFFSAMNFDSCPFPGLDDLARQGFDV